MPEEEPSLVTLVRLEGKIDRLGDQIKASADNLLAKVDAGDRENNQRWALLEPRVAAIEQVMRAIEPRIVRGELSWARLSGVALGASLFGGGVAATLAKVFG